MSTGDGVERVLQVDVGEAHDLSARTAVPARLRPGRGPRTDAAAPARIPVHDPLLAQRGGRHLRESASLQAASRRDPLLRHGLTAPGDRRGTVARACSVAGRPAPPPLPCEPALELRAIEATVERGGQGGAALGLDVGAAHQRERANANDRRPRPRPWPSDLEVVAAHERETPEFHLDTLGDHDVRAAHHRNDGDHGLRRLDEGVTQVEVAPPMTLTTVQRRAIRHRPLRSPPPMMPMIHRVPARRLGGRRPGRSPVSDVSSSRVWRRARRRPARRALRASVGPRRRRRAGRPPRAPARRPMRVRRVRTEDQSRSLHRCITRATP